MLKKQNKTAIEKNILRFSRDTKKHGGYVYTSNNKLSSILANEYQTINTLKLINLKNKTVVDIGCGDGTYTLDLLLRAEPKKMVGIDPSKEGITRAIKKFGKIQNIIFKVGSIYTLPIKEKFDIAILRGVLHHLYKPENAFPEINRVAKKVILIEPNGFNMILKIIEKTSKYHLDHEEKSYFPSQIRTWIINNGGRIYQESFLGLVPFFSPDWMVPLFKVLEPIIENTPILNKLLCGNYYVVYENK